jgi:transcriptional regulator with XRE-family HTH domain
MLAAVSIRGRIEDMATLKVGSLGDYIRDQRKSAQYSLRQLAAAAGVSNPYLSQIERGLKKPSAEILQQIAKALRISAETLYVQAGFLEDRGASSDVVAAILSDPGIGERHKRVLIDIYESFRSGAVPEVIVKATTTKPATRPSTTTRKRSTAKRTAAKRTTDRTTKSTTTRRKTA